MAADVAGAREGGESQASDGEDLEGGGHPGGMSREAGEAVQGGGAPFWRGPPHPGPLPQGGRGEKTDPVPSPREAGRGLG